MLPLYQIALLLCVFAPAAVVHVQAEGQLITRTQVLDSALSYEVDCLTPAYEGMCLPQECSRHVMDNIFSEEDVKKLLSIVEKGMKKREAKGGPTILDINTGFIRDSAGVRNLFSSGKGGIFDEGDFEHYGKVILKLKETVMDFMNISELFFTAPTFITRLDGRDPDWEPAEIHDEYWHVHADRNNTEHYHYSGLLYLNEYEKDFEGGKLHFYDPKSFNEDTHTASEDGIQQTIEPRPGRVVVFTSGHENPHKVERVESGTRFVLAFWFTCTKEKEFEIFLDGEAHLTFSKRIAAQVEKQQQKQKLKEL